DLSPVLAHGGRHPAQAEAFVHLFFGTAYDQLVGFCLEQPVLGELELLADRDLPGGYIVRLGAGEVLERRAPRVQLHHPQVDLEICRGGSGGMPPPGKRDADGGLRGAADNDLAERLECVHQRPGLVRRGEDVDVAYRLPPAAQRARVGAPLAPRHRAEMVDDGRRGLQRDVEQHPVRALPVHLDAVQDALAALWPEALEPVEPALLDRLGQGVDVLYAQLLAEQERALRPEPGDPGQLPDPSRNLAPQFVQRGERAEPVHLVDLGSDRGADAGDLLELLDVELCRVAGVAGHRAGRLLVVPGAERIAAGDLEQFGVLVQEARDSLVRARHAGIIAASTRPANASRPPNTYALPASSSRPRQ